MANHVTIVMVEDDPGHAALIEKNLRRGGIYNPIKKIDNGRVALEYLCSKKECDPKSDAGPILVLLDLNLPEVDGFEILEAMKSNPYTKCIPIIILTTTDNPAEIDRAYKLGCNVYVAKPLDYERFAEAIRKLGLMLSVVELPHRE
ncbi:MAG: response regulator [Alphaproteobacteria bacterium]|nr:response regulator [Alphaproteobacteria bacterium]